MARVRNPLAGFAITIFASLGFSFIMGVPILFFPQPELVYFYLPFAYLTDRDLTSDLWTIKSVEQ